MGTCEFRQLDGHTVFAVLLFWEGLVRVMSHPCALRLRDSVGLSLALIIVAGRGCCPSPGSPTGFRPTCSFYLVNLIRSHLHDRVRIRARKVAEHTSYTSTSILLIVNPPSCKGRSKIDPTPPSVDRFARVFCGLIRRWYHSWDIARTKF